VDESFSSWAGRDERVFVNLPLERRYLAELPPGARILDLGCGDGSHMGLLASGGTTFGVDVSLPLLKRARSAAPVAAGAGERLPFRDQSFDFVYVSHVLHHAEDHVAALREMYRVLRPGGVLFLTETCEDNPLMRLARTLRPEWESVPVRSRFRYATLLADVRKARFVVESTGQFNVLYWIWGFARRKFTPLERLLPQVVRVELSAVRRWRRWSAYAYVVGRRPPGG
jgi:ubiquinone/menaquinone biosynthesis C-methylase UbiE